METEKLHHKIYRDESTCESHFIYPFEYKKISSLVVPTKKRFSAALKLVGSDEILETYQRSDNKNWVIKKEELR